MEKGFNFLRKEGIAWSYLGILIGYPDLNAKLNQYGKSPLGVIALAV